jgi:thioredoxin reductase/polyferredoxin
MGFISRYFNWLQYKTPAGQVERYPHINEKNETSLEGVYVVGDLTGIPLLRLASESGKNIIDQFSADTDFRRLIEKNKDENIYDIIIIGAGPAGIAAGMEAEKRKLNFIILESTDRFSTIINFPKGKPIFAEPSDFVQKSDLKISGGTKESLLEDLEKQVSEYKLPLKNAAMVEKISREKDLLIVQTKTENYKCLRIILAIGKSGNARKLNVQGEDKSKVFNRLFDPADAKDENVLVVGGGDSAAETAIATSAFASSVTLSYRGKELARAKEANIEKLYELERNGNIKIILSSYIKEIKDNSVILSTGKDEQEIPNSMVYTMIGRELPTDFFKRNGIAMEGELSLTGKLQFLLLLLITGVLYFGKSSADFYDKFWGYELHSIGEFISSLFSTETITKFLSIPAIISAALFSDSVRIWNVTKYINAAVAFICFFAAVILGIYLLVNFIKNNFKKFRPNWSTFKYFYFIFIGTFFIFIYFGGKYFGYEVLGKSMSFWYTGLYSLTILIFGLRRMKRTPTKYIKYQTWTLILIQAFPLFILPEIVFPLLGNSGLLGVKDGFILSKVFPGGSYWRSYGFILAWPLNFSNLFNSNITTFWLVFSILQTFVIIPMIIYKWGKGAYCGWICSCGALAETLGDEYRTLALHGKKAKKLENTGQWILLVAFIITVLKLISILYNIEIPVINEKLAYTSDFLQKFYYIGIDVIFAGVLGAGVYFFLSGRVWCRFGCPLAALMHIYSRFSKYRIFADKKRCISCNICTKVCHMGIDVMNFANKGIPMNDVECVRCSTCIVNCPTDVLSFGEVSSFDTKNEKFMSR